MKTLKISEQKARELYKNGSQELKAILEESFGKEFFSQSITDRIKSYEDACEELGINPLNEANFMELGLTQQDIAYLKLATVIKALNEGCILNVCDSDVCRWYPWFRPNGAPSSFAFGFACCGRSGAFGGGGGSRLCYKLKGKNLTPW